MIFVGLVGNAYVRGQYKLMFCVTIMKKYLWLLLCTLAVLVGLQSCDWTDKEPMPERKELWFDAKGGEETMKFIVEGRNEWRFNGLWDEKKKWYIPENRYSIDTLTDGSIRVNYDWVSFLISNDKSSVKVSVQENTTAETRTINFEGTTHITLKASFDVHQRGRAE